VQKLVDRKLIERTKIRNKQGRGRAYRLTVKYSAKTKRLLDAIEKATPGNRRQQKFSTATFQICSSIAKIRLRR
jgi:chromosome segregation and condensation protein ScpB